MHWMKRSLEHLPPQNVALDMLQCTKIFIVDSKGAAFFLKCSPREMPLPSFSRTWQLALRKDKKCKRHCIGTVPALWIDDQMPSSPVGLHLSSNNIGNLVALSGTVHCQEWIWYFPWQVLERFPLGLQPSTHFCGAS